MAIEVNAGTTNGLTVPLPNLRSSFDNDDRFCATRRGRELHHVSTCAVCRYSSSEAIECRDGQVRTHSGMPFPQQPYSDGKIYGRVRSTGTSALFGSCLNTSDHIRLSDLAAKMGSEDPPEILVPTLASSDAAEFRITEALEVQVSDVTRRKHICENRFREARLSRNWHVAHVNQKIDFSCLQRREKIADRAPLVADCMQRR